MAPSIDLKALISDSQTPEATAKIQSQLIDIVDPALNGQDPSSVDADSVASDIDALYKADHSSDNKAEEFIYTLWSLYISIVKQLSVDDPRLPLLASIAISLKGRSSGKVKVWREATDVWKGEPLLASCVRDAWNFSPRYDGSDKDSATIRSWITLNSFAARLLGADAATWSNFAIWSLRSGLEEEEEPSSEVARDSAVAIAYEWIAHAGKVLADKSRDGGKEELSKVDKNALAAGKLFGGEPGLTWERWTFWRQRLEKLAGGDEVSDAGKAKAQKAVDEMKALEK